MPDAWRIDSAKRADAAFSGVGASIAGGRWNPAGIHVVYASQHLATASLEKFIHLPKPVPARMRFVQFEIQFNGASVHRPAREDLPPNWREEPAPAATQQFGLEWFLSGKSCILAAPSAIIPDEENYVINPAHRDFAKLTISRPAPFAYDPRLAALREP